MKSYRKFVVTWNNYTKESIASMKQLDIIRYGFFTEEHTHGEGTPHLQGFIYLTEKVTLKGIIRRMGVGPHIEPMKGNLSQSEDYCLKDDEGVPKVVHEWGAKPHPGARSDMDAIKQLVDAGASDRDIAAEYPGQWVRYHEGIKSLRSTLKVGSSPSRWGTYIVKQMNEVDFGSHEENTLAEMLSNGVLSLQNTYVKNPQSKFWDGYEGQPNVILYLEKMDTAWVHLLKSGFLTQVEIKNSTLPFTSKMVYIVII